MKISFAILLMFLSCAVCAQKENNVWVGGENVGIDFGGGSPVIFSRDDEDRFWRTNTSICDSNGNLLFYSNGYRTFNKNFDIMPNGDNLNIGDYESWGYDLLSVANGAAIIPKPNDPDKYYLVHTDLNYIDFDTFGQTLMSTHLFYCIVDMALDGGLGDIVQGQKDVGLFSDTLTCAGFRIIKHGNGRDYWLICHEAASNRFYRFLIDPYGFHGPYSQYIGGEFNSYDAKDRNVLGFSQDGVRAAQLHTLPTQINLYDFDRCTGEFYNLQVIQVDDSLFQLMGAEFSPSGQYLYVSANYWENIFQFDLQATDIEASRQLIAVYSGALNPFATRYDKLGLAPDGKIYIATYDGCHSLHVIHHPDSAGIACDFEENGLQVYPPGINWSGLPNLVNYSLNALVGSDCDTLTPNYPKPTFTFGVYPNPFSNELQLTITGAESEASFEIYNVLGQQVYQVVLSPQDYTIHQVVDASKFAAGVYFIRLGVNGTEYLRKTVKN